MNQTVLSLVVLTLRCVELYILIEYEREYFTAYIDLTVVCLFFVSAYYTYVYLSSG